MYPRRPIFLWLLSAACMFGGYSPAQPTHRNGISKANPVKEDSSGQSKTNKNISLKPQILTSGFIDIFNNGQVNASARFIRLMIGEPGKFALPLSVYSGVSSNNFKSDDIDGNTKNNDQLLINLINPLSGLINISTDGIYWLKKKFRCSTSASLPLTRTGLLYHAGERLLTGYTASHTTENSLANKPVNFLNSFAALGLFFQTGAWERNDVGEIGLFWLALRYIACYSARKQMQEILGAAKTGGLYHGWSVASGVEINNVVNIKFVYYKYVKKPEIDYSLPIYQFTFNYSLKE